MEQPTMQTIDKSSEFDQTRKHAHVPGVACCNVPPAPGGVMFFSERFNEHITPATLEQRLTEIEAQNEVLQRRLKGFEAMMARLAKYIDRTRAMFNKAA